jgi:uncharacterized protein DUF6765
MQTDMHYYGTYALARAAGFKAEAALQIATASEYVDDSDAMDLKCADGFPIHSEATAHHPSNYEANTDPKDQRRTWVPFHFIPGTQGASDDEKLVCVTDSAVACAVVEHTLDNLGQPFGLQLLGITAHGYADTYSHYGFSGISSKVNRVDGSTIKFQGTDEAKASLGAKLKLFADRHIVGPLANHLAQLGHGAVATFPDQPYLSWEFSYSEPQRPSGLRENPKTFLAACQRLHEVFTEARGKFGGEWDDAAAIRDFTELEPAIKAILAVKGDAVQRAAAWQQASTAGKLGKVVEPIPAYDHRMFDTNLAKLKACDQATAIHTPVYQFIQAADFHRDFILDELLPKYDIHIETIPVEWRD